MRRHRTEDLRARRREQRQGDAERAQEYCERFAEL